MTPEDIAAARRHLNILRTAYHEGPDSLVALARIGLRVVDPSPEDVQRIRRAVEQAGALFGLYTDEARAVLKAIAEGVE